MVEIAFDCFACYAAAEKIRPSEFTERRSIFCISPQSFQSTGQRPIGIVSEIEYSLGHVAVGQPIALIVERMTAALGFERRPEFIETECAQISDDDGRY